MDQNSLPRTLDSSDFRLTTANRDCVSELQSWFSNADELFAWGGPGLEFDVGLETFAKQIKLDELSSYCLRDQRNGLAGFAQHYQRLGRVHLGRIAICPHKRGQGIGKRLLQQLIRATKPDSDKGVSLFVLKHNQAAIRCYQSQGFVISDSPEPLSDLYADMWFMLREPETPA